MIIYSIIKTLKILMGVLVGRFGRYSLISPYREIWMLSWELVVIWMLIKGII